MKEDLGKLIFEIDNRIYRKYRRKNFPDVIIFGIISISFTIATIVIISFGFTFDICCISTPILTVLIILYSVIVLSNLEINQFKVYKNGIIPAIKPFTYYLTNKECFIRYNQLKKVYPLITFAWLQFDLIDGGKFKLPYNWITGDQLVKLSEILYEKNVDYRPPDLDKIDIYERMVKDYRTGNINEEEFNRKLVALSFWEIKEMKGKMD